ncbi:uncharacterized protein N0V89_000923 [Didymosphaeria variabile]|uniref:Uncharacterized protein n=1 Tax=Didymosphaeria variabile TaxID=1932322 RepID=A0A9W8XW27_9PLEO|nr:uncharacterized protein N0V89_000923 [Didymosphaeria variabile]KAJ4360361.1 hypothetical protein N0V89_000923 [Didymosphaeria variabile]
MGVFLSTVQRTLNLLLPFTHPDTPLVQDVIHTAVLVTTLYYAPQIAEYYHAHHRPAAPYTTANADDSAPIGRILNGPPPDVPDGPLDEDWVLQDDGDNEEAGIEPPPHAPTPPPGQLHNPPIEDAAWQNDFANGDPGPANDHPQPTRANRVIGAKKAKSLARRDQRRAYHEFHRSQAEQRRLTEEAGREGREAALAEEKARRAEVESLLAEEKRERQAWEREQKRKEADEEHQRRERVVEKVKEDIVRKGAVDLVDAAMEEGKDKVWIERLVRASGLLSQMEKGEEKVMITGEGWLVKIDAEIMRTAYEEAASFSDSRDGKVNFANFGGILEKVVRARALAAV